MIATAAQMKWGTRRGAARAAELFDDEILVDVFAGGGGASHGIEEALNRSVDEAVNHDEDRVAMHAVNHPNTRHHHRGVFEHEANPRIVAMMRRVGLLWGSPDCTDFSGAKGNKPSNRNSRCLCWALVMWAYEKRPRVIMMENVREFQLYAPLRVTGPASDWRDMDNKREARRSDVADVENTAWSTGTFDSRGRRVTGGTIKRRPPERPDPEKRAWLFNLFIASLRSLGYAVEWKVQNCADFGDATIRRRLFLIARCDGKPIVWPRRTHGDAKACAKDSSLEPWRPVSECIDWNLPTRSIFDRPRPLAENTLKRVHRGVWRYIIEDLNPFLVEINHGGDWFRGRGVDQPCSTITRSRGTALCSSTMVQVGYGEREGQAPRALDIRQPNGTIVGSNKHAKVSAFLAKHYGGVVGHKLDRPLGTATKVDHHSYVSATVVGVGGASRSGEPRSVNEPGGTVLPKDSRAIVSATIVRHGQTGSNGDCVQSVESPASTVVRKAEHSLVSATLLGVGGSGYSGKPKAVTDPSTSVLPQDRRAMAAAAMVRMNHGEKQWNSVREPVRCITSQGNKAGLVAAFLVKYYGTGVPTLLTDPSGVITTKARFGLVTVKMVECVVGPDGAQQEITTDTQAFAVNIPGHGWYIIVDICLRMLTPRELARCHSFPESYILTGSIADQIAAIGNSVPVKTVAAHVRANVPELRREPLPGRRRARAAAREVIEKAREGKHL